MDIVFIYAMMEENIKEIWNKIECIDMVNIICKMGENTKDNIIWTKTRIRKILLGR